MRHFTLVSRILVLFLAVYAFGNGRSGQPALAQDDPPPAPVVEESAKISYQPSADSSTFIDFVPVQATEISISASNSRSSTEIGCSFRKDYVLNFNFQSSNLT